MSPVSKRVTKESILISEESMKQKAIPRMILAALSCVFLFSSHAVAGLTGETNYDVYDSTMATMSGKSYSGGIDIVYSQQATGTAAAKTRSILKCEDGTWVGSNKSVQVNMYSYLGGHLLTLADVNPYGSGIYCQAVKVDPTPLANGNRTVWFSMSGNGAGDGDWYSVVVDEDFTSVEVAAASEFSQPGCWEVEWSTDTTLGSIPFFAGKETNAWTEPHAIYIHSGGSLQKVVDVGGYSCGFAFDDEGNLYTGTYTSSGPTDRQYVRLYSTAQIRNAVTNSTTLTASDAISTIPIPAGGNSADTYLGANDLERDPDGNIYVTANGSWNANFNSDLGFVFRIDACTDINNPPTSMTKIASGSFDSTKTDWQKSLAYDGASNLASGGHYNPTSSSMTGNRLYVDQDFAWGSGGPDVVSGLGDDANSDSDSIPDCFDNAYLTTNANQIDADLDMYGNMADGDFNNDNSCNVIDEAWLNTYIGTSNPVYDMNSDGTVDSADESLFLSRKGSGAPYY